MHFSVVIVLCDMEMQSTSVFMNLRGQDHLVTFAKSLFRLNILKSFLSDSETDM